VKALVVACNTISATCLADVSALSRVPVLGVIEPTVAAAVQLGFSAFLLGLLDLPRGDARARLADLRAAIGASEDAG